MTDKKALNSVEPCYRFLVGAGEMADLTASFDWSNTSLGAIGEWPSSLRAALNIVLNSSFPMCIWWGETELTNLYNDAAKPMYGDKHPAAFGRPVEEAWGATWKALKPNVSKVFRTNMPTDIKNLRLLLNRFGYEEEAYFTFSLSPLRNDAGDIAGIMCVAIETTNEVLAQQQLMEGEERFRKIADSAPIFIAMADISGNAVYFNKPWLEFTDKTLEEMSGLGWLSVLHPEDAPKFENDFKQAFSEKTTIRKEYRFKRADGKYRWMLAVGAPRLTPDGHFEGYFGTYTDFHDLKRTQLALQQSEESFRTLAENIPNLAWMADTDGSIFWYNNRWYEYTGTKAKDMEGWGWQSVHDPAYLPIVLNEWKSSIKSGKPFEMVFPLKGSDNIFKPFLTRVMPIFDDDGAIKQWIGTNTDISEQLQIKQANARNEELEEITKQLAVQRKELLSLNKAKDEFIGMASHQLRTPATAVKQYVSLLIDEVPGPLNPDQVQYLQIAYNSNERELRIINDLLKTAQIDSTVFTLNQQSHDIVQVIDDVIEDIVLSIELRNQSIVFKKPNNSIKILLDATEMKLVLVNLLENASKYSYSGSVIKILIEKTDTYVKIAIVDKGVGISKEDQQRIFEKFTRVDNDLSDTVTGTGLGLYWVKQLVELHKGTIHLTSKLGEGSRFIVKLPL